MALLTGTGATQRNAKFAKLLMRGNTLICLLLYAAGLGYFWLLGHNSLSNATYFSENALLPGLVYSEIKTDTVNYAQRLAAELEHERTAAGGHRADTPHVWLQAKMRQIGLETYTQNFTLHYPLGSGQVFRGRNVYGILRAPRIGSTESFVLSAPYRAPDSLHPRVAHSVPLLLAFASHARKQKYWAKDLIFLITEQEQLGMQAWLEAYHGQRQSLDDAATGAATVLQAGSLEARAGSIQAAINIELPAFDNDYVDVKIEGLNGQLPNLDLVNVVQRIALKEGIVCGHQQRTRRRRNGAKSSHAENFRHMLGMVLLQASGVPNGNHGLFHRYGIAALTLEGGADKASPSSAATTTTTPQRESAGAAALLKLVEGVARSVNNLLERFHQSFFFYLLVASDRFVSIGDYMPALAAMVGALLVKALIAWLQLGERRCDDGEEAVEETEKTMTEQEEQLAMQNGDQDRETGESHHVTEPIKPTPGPNGHDVAEIDADDDLNLVGVGKVLLLVHTVGLLAAYLPVFGPLNRYAASTGLRTEQFQLGLQTAICAGAALVPYVVRLGAVARQVLHVATLLELATVLLIVGMLNFSLAFVLAAIVVPPVLFVCPAAAHQSGSKRSSGVWSPARFLCLLLNPLAVAYAAVLAVTVSSFPELSVELWAGRALAALAEAITFAVVDSMIYGNWIFNLVLQVLLPIWMCLWTITFSCNEDEAAPLPTTPASPKPKLK